MADKKYLDYDGLLYFWSKIKARFDGAISSISGDGSSTTITFTKVDGTTGTFITKDTTYSEATTDTAGLMSAADKTKLNGIATGANKTIVDSSLSSSSTNPVQNKVINTALAAKAPLASPALTGTPTAPTAAAGTNTTQIATTAFVKSAVDTSASGLKIFKTVTVGDTSLVADSATDTLTLEAGANVTLTPDATNDKITIAATDTTYSEATTDAAGLMSAADKTKLNGIATGANKTTVDSSLSSTSTNPVQNKVINTALAAKAPLASPALTGTPTAPTATAGTNTTQIATTAFVKSAVDTASTAVSAAVRSFSKVKVGSTTVEADSATDTLTLEAGDNVTITPDATNDKVTITATDTTYSEATTDAAGLMSAADKTKLNGIATGANKTTVDSSLSSTSTNPVQNKVINTALGTKAPLASPALTGTPTAPTAAAGTNTTQIATTAFVKAAVDTSASGLKIFKTITIGDTSIAADSAADTLTLEAGDNVTLTPDATNDKVTIAATDTTYSEATTAAAGLMSAADKTKLNGIASGANKTTVDTALSTTSTNPVQNKVINTALGTKAPLASPTFTGTPKAPTAAAGTNTTQIATTAFVKAAVDTAVSGLYKYKGSVATAGDLPTTGNVTGDVWDIQQTSTYGAPGTNVVWNGTVWDALGGLFEITSITNAEIDTICAA